MVANNIITSIIAFINSFIDFHDFACGVIVLTALSSFIYFLILNTKMNNAIKSLTKYIENLLGTTDEKMVILNEMITTKAKNKVISTLWKKYYDTLLKYGGQGSSIEISTYFNKITLVDIPTQRKIGEIFPGILIATGILGTFTGLIVGLNLMDLRDSTSIQKSMLPLMGGLKIGFLTSVLGIGTSLIWNVLDRILLHRIVKSVNDFQVAYEQTFPSESLGSYLIEMIKLQSAQTAAVEQMSSNVSEEQSRSSSGIIEEQFYSKLSSSIANAINKSISPLTQGISALSENVKKLENSQSEVNNSQKSVQTFSQGQTVNQSAETQIETSKQINEIFEEVKGSASTQEEIKYNIVELNSSIKEISDTINETVKNAVENSMSGINENFINTMTEVADNIQKGIKSSFDDEIKKVTVHIDDTVESVQKTVENTEKKFDELKGTLKSVDNKLGDKILYPTKTKRGDGEFY